MLINLSMGDLFVKLDVTVVILSVGCRLIWLCIRAHGDGNIFFDPLDWPSLQELYMLHTFKIVVCPAMVTGGVQKVRPLGACVTPPRCTQK